MRTKLRRIVAGACIGAMALANAACTPGDQTANEAYAKQILASIKAGVAVALSDVQAGIDAVCANTSALDVAGTVAGTVIGLQVGPNSTANQQNVQTALAVINHACAVSAANPTDPTLKTLFRQAMGAYAVVKAQGAI